MATALPPGYVMPNPRIPKTLGILNILFSLVLILTGLGYAAYAIAMPILMEQWETTMKRTQLQSKAANAARIKDLQKKELAATNEQEKQQLRAERQSIESEPELVVGLDFGVGREMKDARYFAYFTTEVGTGLILNMLLFTSGINLIRLKDWARKLSLWVAGLKIARLAAMTALLLLVFIPIQAQRVQAQFAKMEASMARGNRSLGPSTANQMAQMTAISASVTAGATLVLGSIYPGLLLWLLTRRSARAACLPVISARPEPSPLTTPPPELS